MSSLRVAFLLALLLVNGASKKPKTLSILSLIPKTGKEPSDGRACAAAMQIVVEAANAQTGILPDYDLKIHFEDEQRSAFGSPRAFLRGYLDGFEQERINGSTNSFMAPVVVGPSISCQNIALTLKQNHFLEFSEICTGQYLIQRRQMLSNLYRIQTPADNTVAAMMLLARKVGQWRQMAVLTYSLNPNEYMLAESLQKHAARNGLQIVHYANEPEITQMVISQLKDNGARVVGLLLGQPALCLQFWCLSYQAGIRGSQYAFIALFFCSFSPDSPNLVFPKGCTRDMLYEQLKITFWAGGYTSAAQSYGNTSLVYDLPWFEHKIEHMLNGTTVPDYDQRHLCHDTIMAGVMTLHKSEGLLRSKMNMTLSDFSDSPSVVANVVNESAAQLDFVGLRIGRIRYSERLEVDSEDNWIAQWQRGAFRLLYRTHRTKPDIDSVFDMDAYDLISTSETPLWTTKTGRPPKDLSDIDHKSSMFPVDAMSIIAVLCVTVASCQLVVCFSSMRSSSAHQPVLTVQTLGLLKRFSVSVNLVVTAGCLCFNVSAIIAATGLTFYPESSCNLLTISTALALFIVNGCLFSRMASFAKVICEARKASSRNTTSGTPAQSSSHNPSVRRKKQMKRGNTTATNPIIVADVKILLEQLKQMRERFYWTTSGIISVGALLLIIWLAGVDPVHLHVIQSPILFDESSDSYYDITSQYCSSDFQMYWIAALCAINAFLLISGAIMAFQCRKDSLPIEYAVDCKLGRLAILNALTIFIGIILIILIVPSGSTGVSFFSKHIVLAVGEFVYSLTTSTIVFYSTWSSRLLKASHRSRTPRTPNNLVVAVVAHPSP